MSSLWASQAGCHVSVSLSEGSQARPGVKGETIHKAVRSPEHRVFTTMQLFWLLLAEG